jgi:pilus assembly protein Flp/PilA
MKLLLLGQVMRAFGRGKRGATMVEYGLLVALIAVVLIVMVGFVGTQLQATFLHIGNELGK